MLGMGHRPVEVRVASGDQLLDGAYRKNASTATTTVPSDVPRLLPRLHGPDIPPAA